MFKKLCAKLEEINKEFRVQLGIVLSHFQQMLFC